MAKYQELVVFVRDGGLVLEDGRYVLGDVWLLIGSVKYVHVMSK